MKQFLVNIIRFVAIGMIPFFVLILGYYIYDPFKVIYTYRDYSYAYVIPNRDYISTEAFINQQHQYHYNSFIFGSSRTLAFRPSSWKKYLSPDDSPFVFDASAESIYGIYKKIKYLDSINTSIKNAIILLCRDYTFVYSKNYDKHLYIKHPATSGESNLFFHYLFLNAYFSSGFLFSFYNYTFTKKYQPYMERYIENRKIAYDTITNELNIQDQEDEIASNPSEYYHNKKEMFYERPKETTNDFVAINAEQLRMLREIEQIFRKDGTNYKVVISPLYEQIKFIPSDLAALSAIFGQNLYDFSGKNALTDVQTNYYETSHYRPSVGDSIFKIIYSK